MEEHRSLEEALAVYAKYDPKVKSLLANPEDLERIKSVAEATAKGESKK